LAKLQVEPNRGLPPEVVQERRSRYGPNQLPAPREPHPIVVFLMQFHQGLVYILIACGVVSALFHDWLEAVVIFGVVLVNAIVGFVQETKATQAIAALVKRVTIRATVLRNGALQEVDSQELVPGDIVVLNAGDKVPADLRLLKLRDLQIDESTLTGESVPVSKQLDPLPVDTPLADRNNLAFCSTLVTYGQATGVVVATGVQTEVGRIATLLQLTEPLATPLTRNIETFSQVLFYVILGLAAITFAVGLLQGQEWISMFQAAVALAVGAVPEALPAAVTATLAIGIVRMARRRAIIRKLPAVEALGSTTVICSDKTGTLTANQLTVRNIWAGGLRYMVTGEGFDPAGTVESVDAEAGEPHANRALLECAKAGILCNDSLVERSNGTWQVRGDPTEGALYVAGLKVGFHPQQLLAEYPRLDAIPFDSQRRYSATLHRSPAENENWIYLKGASEVVLDRCQWFMDPGGNLQPFDRTQAEREVEALAARGLRVLALARSFETTSQEAFPHLEVEGDFVLLGLQAMIDPPRPEAIQAVRTCQQAGIRVKMITGDHALTAAVIARQLGIGVSSANDGAFSGRLDQISQAGQIASMVTREDATSNPRGDTNPNGLNLAGNPPPATAEGKPHVLVALAGKGDEDPSAPLPEVITGKQLSQTSDDELRDVCVRVDVFARVTAEQKLRLVQALQSRGHIVAMTGDGVNDAPALRQADIGVAMGLTGTEVAKEAADMVLTDDNFATIEAAVEEGRGVFDALTKFIVWTLPTNLGDGLVIMAAIFAAVALPILPLQILWINMATVVLLGLVLAFEPKEPDVMLRKPRDPRQPILTRPLVERIFLVGTILLLGAFSLFSWFKSTALSQGKDLELALAEARTVAVNYFVMVQLFYVFNCRSLDRSVLHVGLFSNPWVWVGITSMIALQIVYTYVPAMNRAFQSAPLGLEHWLWILGTSIWVYPIVGLEKWLRRRWSLRRQAVV